MSQQHFGGLEDDPRIESYKQYAITARYSNNIIERGVKILAKMYEKNHKQFDWIHIIEGNMGVGTSMALTKLDARNVASSIAEWSLRKPLAIEMKRSQ